MYLNGNILIQITISTLTPRKYWYLVGRWPNGISTTIINLGNDETCHAIVIKDKQSNNLKCGFCAYNRNQTWLLLSESIFDNHYLDNWELNSMKFESKYTFSWTKIIQKCCLQKILASVLKMYCRWQNVPLKMKLHLEKGTTVRCH